MSKTRIVVLQVKKLVIGAVLSVLGILILAFLFVLFFPKQDSGSTGAALDTESKKESIYQAGIYTKEIEVGDTTVNLELALDETQVKSLELVNLEESVETMYPLMKPTVEKLSEELSAGKDIHKIELSEDAKYTEKMLVESVATMLEEHKK